LEPPKPIASDRIEHFERAAQSAALEHVSRADQPFASGLLASKSAAKQRDQSGSNLIELSAPLARIWASRSLEKPAEMLAETAGSKWR